MLKIIIIKKRFINGLLLLSILTLVSACIDSQPEPPVQIIEQIDNSDGEGTEEEQDEAGEDEAGEEESDGEDTNKNDSDGEQVSLDFQMTIEAEDYVSFQDSDASNQGGAYKNDGVDIEATTDDGGGYNVGWTQVGEYLTYSITLPMGSYELTTRVASETSTGSYNVFIDDKLIGTDSVSSTGGWQIFETHDVGGFSVTNEAEYQIKLEVIGPNFNINWLKIESVLDTDNDGISDSKDVCPDSPIDSVVNGVGCPDSDNDGVFDDRDQCENTEVGSDVDYYGCLQLAKLIEVDNAGLMLVGGIDSLKPSFTLYTFDGDVNQQTSQCNDDCAINWPPLLATDNSADGVSGLNLIVRDDTSKQVTFEGKPLYFYSGDALAGDKAGENFDTWHTVTFGQVGNIVALYNPTTPKEPLIHYTADNNVITKFSDRGRDRHAKEDQFQQYDHYLSHYWTHRTARFKFTDTVANGGDTILIEWVSEWKLQALEFRAWYSGMNTVAQYHGNYEPDVVEHGRGTYDNELEKTSEIGEQFKYSLEISEYRDLNGSREPLAVGQHMEIEVSQFLDGVPEGRSNYYGTTYLYQVGLGKMVPWKTVGDFDDKSSERENSHPIPKEGWLGGETTLPYQYTNEPNDHYMQMATNLSSVNGQPFVLGRRIHHTSMEDGSHDEAPENGIFTEMVGLTTDRYVSHSCASCHVRNGRAAPVEIGESLTKWVFKVANASGETHPQLGNVLQPQNDQEVESEGQVVIANWVDVGGLRKPQYQFTGETPPLFSARIAPSIIGLGLLEAIAEETILANEDVDDTVAPFGISGRAQRVTDPVTEEIRLGRFGWKAGTSSIRHQAAAALNTDMGVRTSVLPNLDCGSAQKANDQCSNASTILPDTDLDNLVKYLALLGVRAQRDLDDPDVQLGKQLFTDIGCADCHTPTLQTSPYHPHQELSDQTIHPYSDLLLHDMGTGLADNLGEGLASGAEWRTTPLWGIGLSACVTGGVVNSMGGQGNEICTPVHSYLHDGRARTIEEAILWHGGEGEVSKLAYEALSSVEKSVLLAFLESL